MACNILQTGHGRPECVDAIVHGRKIGIGGDGIFHKLISQGVVLLRRNEVWRQTLGSWRPTSSRRHRCFLPTTLIGIITGKYEIMAGKRKEKKEKSRCSNDGDFGLRGRRYWRDENDGDSVPMTESWQVCITTKLWCSQTVVYVDATIIRAVFTFFTVGDTCRDGDTLEFIIFRV